MKYSKGKFYLKFGRLEDGFRSTQESALLGYEELGACQSRSHGIPDMAQIRTRYGMWHVPYPYVM